MPVSYTHLDVYKRQEFVFNTKAEKVKKTTEGYRVITNNGVFETKYVVNAAGVYSDEIHNMVSKKKLHIVPRRGEYCLLDKEAGNQMCIRDRQ